MKALRLLAIILALSLMIGELWRSWGAGRHIMAILDDMFVGAFLIFGAVRFTQDTPKRRALFASGWGIAVGMLYGSFFGKVFAPETTNAGNWDLGLLTALVGLAFATAIIGLTATLLLPFKDETS